MKFLRLQRRTLLLLAVAVPLALLFVYVALRSGPLAPVAVTVMQVQSRHIAPALAGIGAVQARHTYKIGPTGAGRVRRIEVQVGDAVAAKIAELAPYFPDGITGFVSSDSTPPGSPSTGLSPSLLGCRKPSLPNSAKLVAFDLRVPGADLHLKPLGMQILLEGLSK